MSPKVYIDGHVGTTGLRIRDWLAERRDLDLLVLPDAERKSPDARREMIRACDLAVLCLPDDAAREAVAWAEGTATRFLDTSTAHRISENWVYGLPELVSGQREAITNASHVSNPGCYASGVLLLLRPLIDSGVLAPTLPLTLNAVSGYSGGGRPMIERWEDPAGELRDLPFEAPYALDRTHKHIPEMLHHSGGLLREPHFVPTVGAYRCGMRIEIPLHASVLERGVTGKRIWDVLDERYRDEPFVRVLPVADPLDSDERTFDPMRCNDTNRMELRVLPHPSGHVLLMAILDNLGKGASGVAIQNLNLMLGFAERTGLPD